MDLGIAGRRALVCASSAGLGFACAQALAGEGVHVVLNGRDKDRLDEAAERLREAGSEVTTVQGDLLDAETLPRLLAACPEPDIVVTNNGGPRPGSVRETRPQDWAAGLEGSLLSHLRLIDAVIDGMCERRFGRIVNITSAMVITPTPDMAVSTAARAGLTAVVKAMSFGVAPYNVTINNLVPNHLDTGRQLNLAHLAAERQGITFEEARRRQHVSIRAGRMGRPEELGAACAFLCGAQSGYISGQNLRLDGGTSPAVF